MDAPTPAPAPDPAATAAAQSKANKETAVAQYGLNATNQITPQGTSTYRQIGTWDDGTPRFEQTTEYSPGEQAIYNTGLATRQNVADIGQSQSSKIGALLNTPVNLNTATEDKIVDLGRARLDPRFERESAALETDLINRGVRPGSEAYANARSAFDQSKNDAYNQLYLSGRGQGAQEALTERNQPINEISALLSNSQVSQPNFTGTPTPGVAPTDYIGAVNQSLAQQNVGFNAAQQNHMGMMNGLFGLGKTALGGWAMSDIDTKENIEVVGERPDGLHVIDFDYKPEFGIDDDRHRGLVAQEVAQVYPDAVARVPEKGNRLAVNYANVPGGMFALGRAA